MANDYKPVNDRTLSDVNAANRDAWDSGEFRHTDAGDPLSNTGHGKQSYPHSRRMSVKQAEKHTGISAHEFKGPGNAICNHPNCGHSANHPIHGKKSEDVRHPSTGGQQVAGESGEVIVHAHDAPGEMPAIHAKGGEEARRGVHLPRTRKRTWKNGIWS